MAVPGTRVRFARTASQVAARFSTSFVKVTSTGLTVSRLERRGIRITASLRLSKLRA